jgi:hypothetical protein
LFAYIDGSNVNVNVYTADSSSQNNQNSALKEARQQ